MSLNHYPPANFDPANTWRGLGFQHKIAVDGTSMSSVMAEQGYSDFCGGFSSKNHIYHGSRLSISNHLDSTGVLLEAAPYVSAWRSTRVPETAQIKCSVTYGSSLPDDTKFALSYPDSEAEIYYQAYGLNNNDYVKYTEPFTVPESAGSAYISAYVVKDGVSSATNVVNFSAFSSTWDTLLGSPRLPWAIYKSIDGGWAAASGEEYLEVADSFTGSRTSECTLSTTVVGPDTLSFQHSELLKDNPYRGSWPHTFADSSFTVWVDNEPVYMLRGATNTLESWTTTDIAIPEGTHKVDFTYSHRSGYVSGETVRIKSVALASAAAGAEETTTTDFPVPYSWIETYVPGIAGQEDVLYETLAKSKGANGRPYWESYVLGLDPTNTLDRFVTTIRMEGGKPIVEYFPTNEVLKASGAIEYILQGKPMLTNGWQDVTFEEPGATNRFFRVKVTW